ncbi:hypothetical protein ACN6A1_10935 [Myxococcus virescens]|uniref:hypothetical protein n=1 Tax=Myxococcus virescens TaxID=83456 RepID=UPI003DA5D886
MSYDVRWVRYDDTLHTAAFVKAASQEAEARGGLEVEFKRGAGVTRLLVKLPRSSLDVQPGESERAPDEGERWGEIHFSVIPSAQRGFEVLRHLPDERGYIALSRSGDDVLMLRDDGVVSRWDGVAVHDGPRVSEGFLDDIWSPEPGVAWVVGDETFHLGPSGWTRVETGAGVPLHRVSGRHARDVWAVGEGVVFHWDGAQWSRIPSPDFGVGYGLWVDAEGVWLTGSNVKLLRLEGSQMVPVEIPDGASAEHSWYEAIFRSGGELWLAAEGECVRWNRGGATVLRTGVEGPSAFAGTSSDALVLVGTCTSAWWDGGSWSPVESLTEGYVDACVYSDGSILASNPDERLTRLVPRGTHAVLSVSSGFSSNRNLWLSIAELAAAIARRLSMTVQT